MEENNQESERSKETGQLKRPDFWICLTLARLSFSSKKSLRRLPAETGPLLKRRPGDQMIPRTDSTKTRCGIPGRFSPIIKSSMGDMNRVGRLWIDGQ